MVYRHQFTVRAPLKCVAEFHRRSGSMATITPPPIRVRVHRAPPVLADGDEMDFSLVIGPLKIDWLARIDDATPSGFTDRLLRGPFSEWTHRHSFIPIDDQTTIVKDEISVRFSAEPFRRLLGIAMWAGLPLLFAYRAWKTRRALQ